MVGISRVYSKQQDTFSSKGISIYNKLQKKVKDGNRYQKKRKSEEGDKVC